MRRGFSAKDLAQLVVGVLAFGVVVLVAANVLSFANARSQLPRDTYLGGVNVSGLTPDQALLRTNAALTQPVILRYGEAVIPLAPGDIDFGLNRAVARLQLEQVVRANAGWDNLPTYALRQSSPTQLALPYTYAETKLLGVLQSIARQYDQPPAPATPDRAGLAFAAGHPGTMLNIADAREPILNALGSALTRTVDLPVDVVPAEQAGMKPLGQAIETQLKPLLDAGGVAGVYVKDLATGQEYSLNGDVAFSAKGWLRVGLALALLADGRPELSGPQVLTDVLVSGGDARLNDVLQRLGNGDAAAGAQTVNGVMKRLGLSSTFLAQPFGAALAAPTIVTPGNARQDVNTAPDPNAQSTPAEIAAMLEMLAQCGRGAGPLPLAYPGKFSLASCNQVLQVLAANRFGGLIESGSAGTTVMRRQSWNANNHGDAALVRGGGRDYVLAVMLNSPNTLDWAQTAPRIANIARATASFAGQTAAAAAPGPTSPPPP